MKDNGSCVVVCCEYIDIHQTLPLVLCCVALTKNMVTEVKAIMV
jgi:hypothetical protein